MIRYFNKIIAMEDNRIPKRSFQWEKVLTTNGWAQEIKTILTGIDMFGHFENSIPCNLSLVWAELFANESILWSTNMQNSPKLRTYKTYKQSLEVEPYVFCLLNRSYRSVLARLRAGVLPLEIETGRWRSIPPEERFCKFCRNGEVEDENHFLFSCQIYTPERTHFFNNMERKIVSFNLKSEVEKLQILMSQENVNAFARFVNEIYLIRQQALYI
jgi:hypothetical protein